LGNQQLKISILTATFNAAFHLPRLIDSLRSQTDRDFEWIVIDGDSKDETLALLEEAKDVATYIKSEPDFGIYHALNKAIHACAGEYYLVLGADDCLEKTAVENFRKAAISSRADVISAPVFVNGIEIIPPQKFEWWRSSPLFVSAHSTGSLIKTSLHEELGEYSRRFPIAADTYFFLQVWKSGKSIYHFNSPVGTFGSSGVSGTDVLGALCESFRANTEVRGNLFIHVLLLIFRIIKNRKEIHRGLMRRSG
jgi:glycosyltransferase involved in cell wall biosynthesis